MVCLENEYGDNEPRNVNVVIIVRLENECGDNEPRNVNLAINGTLSK